MAAPDTGPKPAETIRVRRDLLAQIRDTLTWHQGPAPAGLVDALNELDRLLTVPEPGHCGGDGSAGGVAYGGGLVEPAECVPYPTPDERFSRQERGK